MPIPRSSNRTRFLVRATGVAAAALCAAVPALAQATGCEPLFAAQTKLWETPHHAFVIDSSGTEKALRGGKPTSMELVLVGGVLYVQYNGKWSKSPMGAEMMKKQEAENIKNSKSNCAFVRNETMNGESAALYTMHSVNESSTSDGQIWISKSRGLLLRSAATIDIGDGESGKRRTVTNYDYSHVQKPAGVP